MDTVQLILAIEDSAEDFEVLERAFKASPTFQLSWAKTIAEGMSELSETPFDLILLDLSLPDSEGLEDISTFSSVMSTPVVVLTGFDDDRMASNALQHGAQDYLIKGEFDSRLLDKTIRYAIERHRLVYELSESKLIIQQEQEQGRLQTTLPDSNTPKTANSFGQNALKESNPVIFEYMVKHYHYIFDQALEQRKYKIEYNISKGLRTLAGLLGSHRATSRDVVDIHTDALSSMTTNIAPAKANVCNEEGRYLLMGLLGHLCSFYRNHCYALPSAQTIDMLNSEPDLFGILDK